jgi:hypothetical protein
MTVSVLPMGGKGSQQAIVDAVALGAGGAANSAAMARLSAAYNYNAPHSVVGLAPGKITTQNPTGGRTIFGLPVVDVGIGAIGLAALAFLAKKKHLLKFEREGEGPMFFGHPVIAGAALVAASVYGYKRFKGAPAPAVAPIAPKVTPPASTAAAPLQSLLSALGAGNPSTMSQADAQTAVSAINAAGGFAASDLGQAADLAPMVNSPIGTAGDLGSVDDGSTDTSSDDGSLLGALESL